MIVPLLALLAASFLWSRSLQRRVATRTQSLQQEITVRRGAEAQIESLHRRNEIILNSAGEGIYGVDLEGSTTFVNLAALKLLGYTREELIGKPQHALIHHTRPDGRLYPGEECPIYAAFTDGRVHHVADEVFWRKDGTSFPVEYFSNPMHDDQGALIDAVVTFYDITTRKQAEAALREANQLLEGILSTIPVRVFWKDRSIARVLVAGPVFGTIAKRSYRASWKGSHSSDSGPLFTQTTRTPLTV